MGKAALVHSGFQCAWLEIRDEVMEQMKVVLNTIRVPSHLLEVYVTGRFQTSSLYSHF